MKKYQFKNINREDVLRAINYFDKHDLQYSKPRNTFLNFNNKQYPAKFIRKLSYELKYDEQLTNEDLGGGKETADFFIHRGFQMDYHQHRFKNSPENKDLKIGLYLQLEEYKNQKAFDAMRKVIQNAKLDILVLPEVSFVPFVNEIQKLNIEDRENEELVLDKAIKLSKELKLPILFGFIDNFGHTIAVYANGKAQENETKSQIHLKSTMTGTSYFGIDNYQERFPKQFNPINLKGKKLCLSICYDIFQPLLINQFKENGANIIINITGGNVDKIKWSRALKSRAIESGCSIYSTMGGSGKKNYTFGFSPELEKYESTKIGDEISGSIHIYNQTDKYPVESRSQSATINQNQDFPLNINNLNNSEQITIVNHKDQNIIILQIDNKEIFDLKAITNLINHARKLDLPNKRYVIKNNWTNINKDQKDKIRNILESRAVEFYCCTILNSSKEKYCIQSTKTKGVQYIKQTDNNFVLDLDRMKGLDVPWRNKPGMRHFWLEEYLKLN